MSLCERGKEAAKTKFDVYPSAYANAYAVQVCKGMMPGADGVTKTDSDYVAEQKTGDPNELQRWFKEKWVDVCDGASACGRDVADGISDYPYCRPSVRVNDKTPVTVDELSKKELAKRCTQKRDLEKKAARDVRSRGRSPRKLSRGRSPRKTPTRKTPTRKQSRGRSPRKTPTRKQSRGKSPRKTPARKQSPRARKPNRLKL